MRTSAWTETSFGLYFLRDTEVSAHLIQRIARTNHHVCFFSDKNEFQGRGEDMSSNFSIFPTNSLLSYLVVVVVGRSPLILQPPAWAIEQLEKLQSAPGICGALAIYTWRPAPGPAVLTRQWHSAAYYSFRPSCILHYGSSSTLMSGQQSLMSKFQLHSHLPKQTGAP